MENAMSKYLIKCSCINCHKETTAQSIKLHFAKCVGVPGNTCLCCGKLTHNVKFCSASCRAKITNTTRTRKDARVHNVSQRELHRIAQTQRFYDGLIKERSTLRKHLSILKGYKCECCGVSEWNSKPITLIVDHINGDAGNNTPSNLRLLCPNCNSQTDTFGGRNKGNGRKSRGLPLH